MEIGKDFRRQPTLRGLSATPPCCRSHRLPWGVNVRTRSPPSGWVLWWKTGFCIYQLPSSAQAAVTKTPQTGGLKQQTSISGSLKLEIRVPAWLGEVPPPGLQRAAFLLASPSREKELRALHTLRKAPIPPRGLLHHDLI